MLAKCWNSNPLNKSLASGFRKKNNTIIATLFMSDPLLNNQTKKQQL